MADLMVVAMVDLKVFSMVENLADRSVDCLVEWRVVCD